MKHNKTLGEFLETNVIKVGDVLELSLIQFYPNSIASKTIVCRITVTEVNSGNGEKFWKQAFTGVRGISSKGEKRFGGELWFCIQHWSNE